MTETASTETAATDSSSTGDSTEPARGGTAAAARPNPPGRCHVLVVCSGNICRSPMGEHVLRRAFAEAGLADAVTVSSAGTGDWHVGAGAHPPAQRILAEAGYPTDHVARQVTAEMVDAADLVLAADRGHERMLMSLAADPSTVRLLRTFDPEADGDELPDPYGYDDEAYREVLAMLHAAAPGVVDEVRSQVV